MRLASASTRQDLWGGFFRRERHGRVDQGRSKCKVLFFAERAIILQSHLGHLPVAVCNQYVGCPPSVRGLWIGQQHHVLAGTILRTMMRARAMLHVVAKGALQVESTHDLVASPF
jgi:hypothetical protein